jgi:hypothetical protein
VPVRKPASGYVMIFRRPPDRGDRSIRYFPRAENGDRISRVISMVPPDLSYGSRRLRFHFSKHVLEELEERLIPRMLVERVLESPGTEDRRAGEYQLLSVTGLSSD